MLDQGRLPVETIARSPVTAAQARIPSGQASAGPLSTLVACKLAFERRALTLTPSSRRIREPYWLHCKKRRVC